MVDTKSCRILLWSPEIARSYPNDPAQRLDGFLLAKLSNYLQSHTLKMKLFDGESLEKVESAFQGRKGKIGKKGGLEGLLAAAMMMKGNARFGTLTLFTFNFYLTKTVSNALSPTERKL